MCKDIIRTSWDEKKWKEKAHNRKFNFSEGTEKKGNK